MDHEHEADGDADRSPEQVDDAVPEVDATLAVERTRQESGNAKNPPAARTKLVTPARSGRTQAAATAAANQRNVLPRLKAGLICN